MHSNNKSVPTLLLFKPAPLAAALALALSAPAAFAAAPSATQLPGNGVVTAGTASGPKTAPTSGSETIKVNGNPVITWGGSSGTPTLNTKQPGGFNIGSSATLNFQTTGGAATAVLNIDASGNPSQIMGHLNDTGSTSAVDIFVANGNGIIVGSGATISSGGAVGLIGESGSSLDYTSGPFSHSAGGPYDGLAFNGTAGGDVAVSKGASINGGSTVLVAGGGNVNVDLGALTGGAVTLLAGENQGGGSFASTNKSAVLMVSGQLPTSGPTGTIVDFDSAGDAVNNGTVDLSSGATVKVGGTFTNAGDLTLPPAGAATGQTLTVVNNGKLTTSAGASTGGSFAALTNNGTYDSHGSVFVSEGDLVNSGTIDATFSVGGFSIPAAKVTNGGIVNSGIIKGLAYVETISDPTAPGYKPGADYSITNSGTISGITQPIYANYGYYHHGTASTNDSTGSFTNTGTLDVGGSLSISAYNDVNLGGQVEKTASGAMTPTAVSASNPLSALNITAGNGALTLSTALASTGGAILSGQQVKLMANLSGVDGSGNPNGTVTIVAGDKPTSGYAVRVAAGKTVSADTVDVYGQSPSIGSYDHPNVILQGVISGNTINLGGTDSSNGAVSDVFTGPAGGLNVLKGGASTVTMNFTGVVKNAKYTNSSNFRYNYLPITAGSALNLMLNPIAYQTNGTTGVSSSGSPSAVNILVNNDVTVTSFPQPSSVPDATGSAVTGVNTWPNTHLVLQSTGNVDLTATLAANSISPAGFYWPGLVYLGNIDTANGQPAPGTVNPLGQITTAGVFNNVLPGNTDAGGGIHFMTALPLQLGGDVVTNANSWVNFATDTLTNHYASTNPTATNQFYGGVLGTGNVVNYSLLPSAYFHTQVPVSTQ